MLTEIYLCHACSYHEVENGNGPDRHFPALRILWMRSPHAAADIFQVLAAQLYCCCRRMGCVESAVQQLLTLVCCIVRRPSCIERHSRLRRQLSRTQVLRLVSDSRLGVARSIRVRTTGRRKKFCVGCLA
jgi:hypothetical protein